VALDWDKALEIGKFELIDYDEAMNTPKRMFVGDETVMNNPLYDKAFENILKSNFKPKHKTAFLSLCAGKRPYYESAKWKKYMNEFDCVDYIVTSNGGIIPEPYWHEFIYLVYDAPARESGSEGLAKNKHRKHNVLHEKMVMDTNLNPGKWLEGMPPKLSKDEVYKLYKKKLYNRLIRFFSIFKYDYIFGDFTCDQRNYEPFIEAMEYLKSKNIIKDYDMPEKDIKERCKDLGYLKPHGVGRMFPTLHSLYLKESKEKIQKLVELAGDCNKSNMDVW
jgi:hypothetical protein